MKKTIILLILISSFILSTEPVYSNAIELPQIEMELNKPEAQSIEYSDEFGENIVLSIEPFFSVFALNRGTYKVSKKMKNNWVTTYNVTINNSNQITSANNLNIVTLRGKTSNKSLSYSRTRVVGTFQHKYGLISTKPNVITTIENNRLIIK